MGVVGQFSALEELRGRQRGTPTDTQGSPPVKRRRENASQTTSIILNFLYVQLFGLHGVLRMKTPLPCFVFRAAAGSLSRATRERLLLSAQPPAYRRA